MSRSLFPVALLCVLANPLAALACDSIPPSAMTGGSLSVGRIADLVWTLRELRGAPLAEGVEAWVTVGADGRISGSTGCNHLAGTATLDAGVLEFGQLAVTEMACDAGRMAAERQVLAALAAVRGFVVGPDRRLYLLGQDGTAELCLE